MTSPLNQLTAEFNLTPRTLSSYLGAAGWQLQNASAVSQTWTLEDAGTATADLLLPLDNSFVDFEDRFNAALRRLCRVYDWDYQQLVTSILSTRSDFFLVRADQATPDGSIPLRQAEQLVGGTLDMLTAAAWASIEPRPLFVGRRPNSVRNFVEDDLRMGHTQRGSFVITVLARLDEDEEIGLDAVERESFESLREFDDAVPAPTVARIPPFQRRVMSTLASGLVATKEAARERTALALDEAIARGVSANLCESLEGMTKFQGLRTLDLSFMWAIAEQVAPPSAERVLIGRNEIPRLGELSQRLRQKPPQSRESLYGQVTRLERAEENDEGIVTVRGVTGRSTRRQARLHLEGRRYDAAIRAHRSRLPVVVTGVMERRGNMYWLSEVDFQAADLLPGGA